MRKIQNNLVITFQKKGCYILKNLNSKKSFLITKCHLTFSEISLFAFLLKIDTTLISVGYI